MHILFWTTVTLAGGLGQASIASAKISDQSSLSTCSRALQTFPTTRPRGIYPSGFKSRGKITIASIEQTTQASDISSCRLKVQEMAGMKLVEVMRELHEAVFVVSRRVAPLMGADLNRALDHANQSESMRGVVDRAISYVVRQGEFCLYPFFDEMRVILGDLSQWYQGSYARIALLRALVRQTEYSDDLAPQQGPLLSALASELADLGPTMKDAEFRELKNVTNQLLAQGATLAEPARRFMFVIGLINARLDQPQLTRGALGNAYLEFLFEQLRSSDTGDQLLRDLSSSAQIATRQFTKRVIETYRADRQFLKGYNMNFVYDLAGRFEPHKP